MPGALRRAARPDRDHRARRVDRRDRGRRRGCARLRHRRGRRARRRPGGGDVVGLLRHRRPGLRAAVGAKPRSAAMQNELARDSYSYIHFLLVAGIVLVALGLKTVDRPQRRAPARRPGLRPARRRRDLPDRPRRLPLPPHPLGQPPAAGTGDRPADPGAGRDPDPGGDLLGDRRRTDLGDDRLRAPRLRRGRDSALREALRRLRARREPVRAS